MLLIFLLIRFLEWKSEKKSNIYSNQIQIEAPLNFYRSYIKTSIGTCPICKKSFQNPVVLPTGYAYCKACLTEGCDPKIFFCIVTKTEMPFEFMVPLLK